MKVVEDQGFKVVFVRFIRTLRRELLIMRTLRFVCFGPSCSCWTAPSSQQRRACTSAVAAHAFVSGIRFREQQGAIRDYSVQESLRPRGERSFASSFSTIYGGFGVSCQRALYSTGASKKGKSKDVLLEDGDLLVEDRSVGDGEGENLNGKKTKKKKKVKELLPESGDAVVGVVDDGVANVVSEDAELLTKLKKKKTKNKLKQEEVLETDDSGMVHNGASTAEEIQETTEPKGKQKKLKNKKREPENELSDPESASVIEDVLAEEFEEHLDDDDFWEDDFEPEAELNDGGDGGGIVLGDAAWAKTTLELAEKVVAEFNGALEIFAFKVSKDTGIIRVRVDKLSDKYGSPTMDEIQLFSSSYSKLLDKAGEAKTIPDDLALEVSSPGAERVVRIPKDLERFKDLPMYVRYIESSGEETPEKDGIMELESVDMQVGSAKWKLADVRLNRDLAGKGRGMTRKQKDWRVDLPFERIQLVRLYIDV